MGAMMASLVCLATVVFKIPTPIGGYANLGDCLVLFSAFILSPFAAFLSSAVGSALADVISGYALYAPATFLIKGAMALVALKAAFLFKKRFNHIVAHLLGGIIAELVMVAGYFVFEGAIYGFGSAALNIPANAVQGVVGIAFALLLYRAFPKISKRKNK